jgi:hypothetical protein
MANFSDTALNGAELILLHDKHKLSMGSRLTTTEKLGAAGATASELRSHYGPVPADAEPVDVPLPETVKGAIANAHS